MRKHSILAAPRAALSPLPILWGRGAWERLNVLHAPRFDAVEQCQSPPRARPCGSCCTCDRSKRTVFVVAMPYDREIHFADVTASRHLASWSQTHRLCAAGCCRPRPCASHFCRGRRCCSKPTRETKNGRSRRTTTRSSCWATFRGGHRRLAVKALSNLASLDASCNRYWWISSLGREDATDIYLRYRRGRVRDADRA